MLSSTFRFSSSGHIASHVTSNRICNCVQRKFRAFVFLSNELFVYFLSVCSNTSARICADCRPHKITVHIVTITSKFWARYFSTKINLSRLPVLVMHFEHLSHIFFNLRNIWSTFFHESGMFTVRENRTSCFFYWITLWFDGFYYSAQYINNNF